MQQIKPTALPNSFSFSSHLELRVDSVKDLQPNYELGKYKMMVHCNPGSTLITADGRFPPAVSYVPAWFVPSDTEAAMPTASVETQQPLWVKGEPVWYDSHRFIPVRHRISGHFVALVQVDEGDEHQASDLELILEAPELKARELQLVRTFM